MKRAIGAFARIPAGTAGPSRASRGFTLIELILATSISAIVIGILSVCLTFALRAWENTQNRGTDQTTALVDLLKLQLAELDPTPIRSEGGLRPLFAGSSNGLHFVTAHSVKAISHGVPVVVRYSYDAKTKRLFYAEKPFDPYHPGAVRDFLGQAGPQRAAREQRSFYEVDMPGFVLSYAGKDADHFTDKWDHASQIPIEVMLRWTDRDSKQRSRMFMVNCPFPMDVKQQQATGVQQGGQLFE